MKINHLHEMLDALKLGELELTDNLPVWGDAAWDNPSGVWSWNASHAIVGTCVDDLEIVPLEETH